MILIVTNKSDYTSDYLILELNRRAIEYARFNTEDFPTQSRLNYTIEQSGLRGSLKLPDKTIDLSDITSIWYRRPARAIPHSDIIDPAAKDFVISESHETLSGLWRLLQCFWVSHPDNLQVAESKPYQLKVASSLGFTIPETLITNQEILVKEFSEIYSKNKIIYKPLQHSRIYRGEKVSLIYTNLIHPEQLEKPENIQYSPSLFQPYIPKKLEIRVTVVGSTVFAVELHSQEIPETRHDWRRVNSRQIKHIQHTLPSNIEQKCISLVETLGLAFGAIDLILTPDNDYVFLEINPNGQWAWIQQTLPEVDIRDALIRLLQHPRK